MMGSAALVIIPSGKPGADWPVRVTAGRRPGRMPGPSTREGKPAVGIRSPEQARAKTTVRVAEGCRPWRWIPASRRNDGTCGRTHDQGRVSQGKTWGRLDPIPPILEPGPFLSPEGLNSAALHPGSASGANSRVRRIQGPGADSFATQTAASPPARDCRHPRAARPEPGPGP
jgi:hypothetical protein